MRRTYRAQAMTAGGATLLLALYIAIDAYLGVEPLDRRFGVIVGGIALAVVVGSAIVRLHRRRLAWLLASASMLQAALGLGMLVGGLGSPGPVLVINALLCAGYGAAAWLFRRSFAGRGDRA